MAFNGASSSSSSSFSSTHDVFLSFRGEDTRNNFTAHLYAALHQNGINTYIDNNLERGENISPALINAIKESRISVIVLSQNYASSSWCLDELATILECKETKGQIVLPVFYKVEPSEVRHQKKSFEEAFAEHEEKFKDDQMKVQRWKTALTKVANLSGYHLGNRNEHDFIKEIIDQMNLILVKETKFQVARYLVGIEPRLQVVQSCLDIKKKDKTCMVGIVGIGGIGKTTLAKAIYNSIASRFEGSCFLGDIRETSSQIGGLIRLQKELLSNILRDSSLMVNHVDQGVTLIEERLRQKRILLVLDDVDQSAQLEKLAGKNDWFGLGSRIIITTRDQNLLLEHEFDSTYRVMELNHNEALQLFSLNAFRSDKPNDGYEEVTKDAVSYCGGLPLALNVLGSALKGRNIVYWKSKLDDYKRNPDKKIQEILKISYDGLDHREKNIFLDIACFFKGKKLEKYDLFPYHVIQVLANKFLISIDERTVIMHDLLQEVGREIVRNESHEPGERSRLWFHEDVLHVLEEKTGTNKVEGILIDFSEPDQIQYLSPEAFEKMKRLRYIIIYNAHFSEELTFLSNELRLIDWFEYPRESFPSNFRGSNLVVLRMFDSHLRELKGLQHFKKLTTMDFTYCDFLEKIPDVSSLSNLKSLELHFCENLVEVHRSVGLLDKLVKLKVSSCKNLVSFPRSLKLRFLKSIMLKGCPRLKNFPEIECKMECLKKISSDCNMKELSSSICLLLEDNRQSIEKSSISSGTELLQQLPSTNTSNSSNNSFSNVFPKLIKLDVRNIALSESNFFRAFGCASTLSTLNLSWSDIVSLPREIESFVGLKDLCLGECKQLKEILGLPPNVKEVYASGCVSLEIMRWDPPEPVGVEAVSPTQQPSNRFLQWEYLDLEGCIQLREISKLSPRIECLKLKECTSLERLPFNNIWNDLPKLDWIDFSNCPEHIGNDLQIQLSSEGHPKYLQLNALQIQLLSEGFCNELREILFQLEERIFSSEGRPKFLRLGFECIYPRNMIPDWFNYRKEVLNTNSCEIDINGPQPFDFENTIFAFSAVVFGPKRSCFEICVVVIKDGQKIYFTRSNPIERARSDHVWLSYTVPFRSQLNTNNFRVEFTFKESQKSMFFKSCGFHLIHRYEEKAVDSTDGIQHSKRRRDDDDDGNLESNRYPQPKRGNLEFQM